MAQTTCRLSIHEAAKQDDVEEVKRCIEEGDRIDSLDSDGNTPLILAAREGKLGACRYLLDHGYTDDPDDFSPPGGSQYLNAQDKDGYTALHWACRTANLDLFRLLIGKKWGLDLSCPTLTGDTPLYLAIVQSGVKKDEALEIAEGLLENHGHGGYDEALSHACDLPDDGVVELLLKIPRGAANLKELLERTVSRGSGTKVKQLLKSSSPDWGGPDYGIDKEDAVEALQKGCRTQTEHKEGRRWTPLHYAAEAARTDIVEALLEEEGWEQDINCVSPDGKTPYEIADSVFAWDAANLIEKAALELESRHKKSN